MKNCLRSKCTSKSRMKGPAELAMVSTAPSADSILDAAKKLFDCAFCEEFMEDAAQTQCCHVFCQRCIKKLVSCPECNSKISRRSGILHRKDIQELFDMFQNVYSNFTTEFASAKSPEPSKLRETEDTAPPHLGQDEVFDEFLHRFHHSQESNDDPYSFIPSQTEYKPPKRSKKANKTYGGVGRRPNQKELDLERDRRLFSVPRSTNLLPRPRKLEERVASFENDRFNDDDDISNEAGGVEAEAGAISISNSTYLSGRAAADEEINITPIPVSSPEISVVPELTPADVELPAVTIFVEDEDNIDPIAFLVNSPTPDSEKPISRTQIKVPQALSAPQLNGDKCEERRKISPKYTPSSCPPTKLSAENKNEQHFSTMKPKPPKPSDLETRNGKAKKQKETEQQIPENILEGPMDLSAMVPRIDRAIVPQKPAFQHAELNVVLDLSPRISLAKSSKAQNGTCSAWPSVPKLLSLEATATESEIEMSQAYQKNIVDWDFPIDYSESEDDFNLPKQCSLGDDVVSDSGKFAGDGQALASPGEIDRFTSTEIKSMSVNSNSTPRMKRGNANASRNKNPSKKPKVEIELPDIQTLARLTGKLSGNSDSSTSQSAVTVVTIDEKMDEDIEILHQFPQSEPEVLSSTIAQPPDSENSDPRGSSPVQRHFVFCATRLSRGQLGMLQKLCGLCGGRIVKNYDDEVTHLILNLEGGRVPQTMKYLFAIANQKWIIIYDWVEECLKADCIVPEEPFETSNFPQCDSGVRKSRVAKSPLFKGINFHIAGHMQSSGTSISDCKKLLVQLGGSITSDLDEDWKGSLVIVGDPLDLSVDYQKWFETNGWLTISWEWILDCILTFNLVPFSQSHLITTVDRNNLNEAQLPPPLRKAHSLD